MSESPGAQVTSPALELEFANSELDEDMASLELDETLSLELDSTTLLELGAIISDELLAGSSEELLCSNSPQPSGGQYTPYRGCASSS